MDLDAIYVRDGNVWTSAGVTAVIDLALALVADDHGRQAAAVARQLVVYLQRSGHRRSSLPSWPGKRPIRNPGDHRHLVRGDTPGGSRDGLTGSPAGVHDLRTGLLS